MRKLAFIRHFRVPLLQDCELQKGRTGMFLPTTVPRCHAQGLAHKRSLISVD